MAMIERYIHQVVLYIYRANKVLCFSFNLSNLMVLNYGRGHAIVFDFAASIAVVLILKPLHFFLRNLQKKIKFDNFFKTRPARSKRSCEPTLIFGLIRLD